MSLQVWLPLNGDLHNQGLSNINVTNNGATVNDNGKIGKCYSFGTAASDLTLPALSMTNFTTEASISFWIKILSWNTSYATFFQAGPVSTAWTAYRFGILRNNANSNLCFTISNGSSASNANYTTSNLELNTWYHLSFCYKTGHCLIYINGVLYRDYTTTIVPNFAGITTIKIGRCTNGSSYQTNCLLNDFRIYDHCLSEKEVEELAKGLVLHYKLDDAYIEPTTILSSEITTTAYNASLNKYGYNTDSNLGKVEGVFQGKSCVKVYTLTAGQRAQPYSYFSNLYTSNGTNSPAYKALSFDYFTTVPTTTWLNFYKLGSGTGTATWRTINTDGIFTGVYTNSSNSIKVKPNEWNHIEIVFNGTSNADAQWGYCINGPAHTSDTNYYFLYANIQLEENDHVTGYGNQIMHNSICYDSSGYNNDGTVIGSIDSITNSPVYNMAISMNNTGTSNHIESTKNIDISSDAITVSCWVKATSKATNQVFFTMSNIQFGTLNNLGYVNPTNMAGFTLNNFINNEWNHIVVIKNGSTYQLYINGIAETQNGANNYYVHNSSKLWLLNRSYNNNYAANASIVDLRVYATILSINDIKELYNTSTTIDNKGNIYARELVEI